MVKSGQKILLVDGNALFHRAYHALPPLSTGEGELVNAVFGFTSILLKSIKDLDPTHVVVAWDEKGPTFRHEIYNEYKAQRVAPPEELFAQFPRVKEVVDTLGIPMISESGYEADDIIGTLSKIVNIPNYIVTGDKDLFQLIDNDTEVYALRRGIKDTAIVDRKYMKEKYGLTPTEFIDYKALRGDPSDNIPGAKGIGEKSAIKLIQTYGSIEKVYAEVDRSGELEKFGPRAKSVVKKLTDSREEVMLAKNLVTIKTDMKFKFSLSEAKFGNFDRDKVASLFQSLGFRSLLTRIPERETVYQVGLFASRSEEKFELEKTNNLNKVRYKLVKTERELKVLNEKLKKENGIVFDTETTSEKPLEAKLVGISFSVTEKEAYYVPFLEKSDLVKFTSNKVIEILGGLFNKEKLKLWAQNGKYDLEVLKKAGFKVGELYFDTMIAAYILNAGRGRYNLDDLAFAELSYEMMSFEDLVGKGREKKKITEVNLEKLAFYSCEDADITLRLKNIFGNRFKSEKKLYELFRKIEMPLVEVLMFMEEWGFKVDKAYLLSLGKDFEKEIEKMREKIYVLAGKKDFNVNSTQQLSKILFKELGLPTTGIKKNQTGYSTAASELKKIRNKHPVIAEIEKYRELAKLKNTYIDSLPKSVDKKTLRIHTSFNQTIAATGRLTSSDPNFQNIPIRTKEGRKIRNAFVSEDGYTLLASDYSQIDLRVVADISGDKKMIESFKRGEDIHTATAALVFKKKPQDVTRSDRRIAKTVNFGIIYGMSPYGLSIALGIEREEAKEFIDGYLETFKGVAKYMKEIVKKAKKQGYVETLLGRRRYFPEFKSSSQVVVKQAERVAINMPVQGTSADIIKIAMVDIFKEIKSDDNEIRMLSQVHDELIFEIRNNKIKKYSKIIKEKMEKAYELKVPLKVDIAVGKRWSKLKEMSEK